MKNMRAMAMDSMMGEEKSPYAKKKPEIKVEIEAGDSEGMESILVTPEEKQMIMAMRKGEGAELPMEDDESEGMEGMLG